MLNTSRSSTFQVLKTAEAQPESIHEDETAESHHASLSAWRRWQARLVTKCGIDTRHHTLVVAAVWTTLYLQHKRLELDR